MRGCNKKKKEKIRIRTKSFIKSFLTGYPDESAKRYSICKADGTTARACLRLCCKMFGISEKNRTFSRQQLDILAERLCKCDKDASDSMLDTAPYI